MKTLLLAQTIFMLVLSGCPEAKPENFDDMVEDVYKNTVPLMNASQLAFEMNRDSSIVILDSREPSEFDVSHLKNAKVVGYNKVDLSVVDTFPKDTKIVVYCSIGYRSERVGEQLQEKGFTNVHNLYGGIFDWVNNDYDLYRGDTIVTDTVHVYDNNWGKWCFKGVKVH